MSSDTGSKTYGLWPDDHPNVLDNGNKSDVRVGKEDNLYSKASYCRLITKQQSSKLEQALSENNTWRYTNTCASFASETFEDVTGVNVNANDILGFETPRTITESIEKIKKNKK